MRCRLTYPRMPSWCWHRHVLISHQKVRHTRNTNYQYEVQISKPDIKGRYPGRQTYWAVYGALEGWVFKPQHSLGNCAWFESRYLTVLLGYCELFCFQLHQEVRTGSDWEWHRNPIKDILPSSFHFFLSSIFSFFLLFVSFLYTVRFSTIFTLSTFPLQLGDMADISL